MGIGSAQEGTWSAPMGTGALHVGAGSAPMGTWSAQAGRGSAPMGTGSGPWPAAAGARSDEEGGTPPSNRGGRCVPRRPHPGRRELYMGRARPRPCGGRIGASAAGDGRGSRRPGCGLSPPPPNPHQWRESGPQLVQFRICPTAGAGEACGSGRGDGAGEPAEVPAGGCGWIETDWVHDRLL